MEPTVVTAEDLAAKRGADAAGEDLAAKRKLIEERVRIAKEKQAAGEPLIEQGEPLTRAEVIKKLADVPVFVVLNGDNNAVSIHGETGVETIYWHLDPQTAAQHLEVVKEQSPSVPGLHVGAMSLAIAFPLAAGWEGTVTQRHAGDAGGVAGVEAPPLQHSVVAASVADVQLPVFLCDQLQTQLALPVFFDRRDLAAAWVQSGRAPEAFSNENLMVLDLRKLTDDMQSSRFRMWSTVRFVASSAALRLLTAQRAQDERAVADGELPPPLE